MPDRLRAKLDHPLNEPVKPPAAREELSTRSEKKYPLSKFYLEERHYQYVLDSLDSTDGSVKPIRETPVVTGVEKRIVTEMPVVTGIAIKH